MLKSGVLPRRAFIVLIALLAGTAYAFYHSQRVRISTLLQVGSFGGKPVQEIRGVVALIKELYVPTALLGKFGNSQSPNVTFEIFNPQRTNLIRLESYASKDEVSQHLVVHKAVADLLLSEQGRLLQLTERGVDFDWMKARTQVERMDKRIEESQVQIALLEKKKAMIAKGEMKNVLPVWARLKPHVPSERVDIDYNLSELRLAMFESKLSKKVGEKEVAYLAAEKSLPMPAALLQGPEVAGPVLSRWWPPILISLMLGLVASLLLGGFIERLPTFRRRMAAGTTA